jgi:hypothetical protein
MSDKTDYLIATLDMHLSAGKAPEIALLLAIEDYADVWHANDGETTIARASKVALKRLREDETMGSEQ